MGRFIAPLVLLGVQDSQGGWDNYDNNVVTLATLALLYSTVFFNLLAVDDILLQVFLSLLFIA